MAKKIVGHVDLTKLYLKELPEILKDITVSGDFYCLDNKLTSLIGAPSNVGGEFDCGHNKLTSLEGAPTSVGGSFFSYSNKLTTLVGAPTSVGGHFYCYDNPGKFTEAQVRAVCDVKGNVYV